MTPETPLHSVAVMVCNLLNDPHFRASLIRELQVRGEGHPSRRSGIERIALAVGAWGEVQAELGQGLSAAPRPRSTSQPRRVLVIAGDEPEAVLLRSYAERLAWDMAAIGHSVVVARLRRGRLTGRLARDGEPTILELEAGPLPSGTTPENHRLALAGPVHRRLERLIREHGPFDALMGEGTQGNLSGPPLAQQFGLPLLLALDRCEVALRNNHLSREQLYTAELEHWACDRARVVLASNLAVERDLRQHYKLTSILVVAPSRAGPSAPASDDAARLLRRLAIEAPFVLVLAHDERRAFLDSVPGRTVVLAGRGVWLRRADGSTEQLSDRPVVGPALGALLTAAEVVVATGEDLRSDEAQRLASRFVFARVDDSLERLVGEARPPRPTDASTSPLDGLLAELSRASHGDAAREGCP